MGDTRHFRSLADLPGEDLPHVLDLASQMKADHSLHTAALAGKRIALLFLNASLRTRSSMELASQSLGAHVVSLTPGAGSWKLECREGVVMDGDCAEHLVDAIRVLTQMADLIAVRCFAGMESLATDVTEPILSRVVAESRVPVVNMESALDHPLQALADLLTMEEAIPVADEGTPVALTWAPHPRPLPLAVPAAFLRAAGRAAMDVRVAAPAGFELPEFLLDEARALGAQVVQTDDQRAAVTGARVVYAKSWAAPGLLGDADADLAARAPFGDWTVDEDLMDLGNDAVFMHCLPVRRNVVVTDGVLDGRRSRVYQQAGNRLHTARALLHHLLG